jgi:hypothetical protein
MHRIPALASAVLTLVATATLRAQPLAGPTRSTSISFASAGETQDGYDRASVGIRYAAAVCFDEVGVAFEVTGGSLETGPSYWYKGVRYDIPDGIRTTSTSGLRLDATVYNGVSRAGRIAENAPQTDAGLGCYGQFRRYGMVEQIFAGKPTRNAALDYLRGITITTDRTPRPLRDMAIESALARRLAQARQDSLRTIAVRDSIARRDSIQAVNDSLRAVAVRDSIARRDALKRRADSLSTLASRDSMARRDSARVDSQRQLARSDSIRRAQNDSVMRVRSTPKPLTAEEKSAIGMAVREFSRAEDLFRQRRYSEAMPIYQTIAYEYGPYTTQMRETAKARLNSMNGAMAAQTTAAATVLLSQSLGAAVGFSYMTGYFEGDNGLVGMSIHKSLSKRRRMFLLVDLQVGMGPIADIYYAVNGIEQEISEAERGEWGARVGMSLPVPIFVMPREIPFVGGKWYPTVGYQIVGTGERNLNLLSTGLLFGPDRTGQGFRLDVHFVNGEPRYGGAFAFSF